MTKKINLKLFFILVLAGAVTGLMVLPFTFALIELPPEVPMALVVVAQTVQQTLLLAFSCFLGLWLVQKTELKGLGITECLLRREKPNVHFKKLAAQAVLWGLLGGACTVVLCIPFWDVSVKLLQDEMRVALWKSVLACFYGGVGEEILFRLGMMTFFVWLLQKCKLKKAAYWTAIILTGILFGLGHMGITGSLDSGYACRDFTGGFVKRLAERSLRNSVLEAGLGVGNARAFFNGRGFAYFNSAFDCAAFYVKEDGCEAFMDCTRCARACSFACRVRGKRKIRKYGLHAYFGKGGEKPHGYRNGLHHFRCALQRGV